MKSKMKSAWEKANLFLLTLMASSTTFAGSASGNKLVAVFDSIVDFLTSTLARGVGITAIAAVGYLYLFQNKIDKLRAVSICASIGIILGATSLYDMLAGA